jgi:hypothetical protein
MHTRKHHQLCSSGWLRIATHQRESGVYQVCQFGCVNHEDLASGISTHRPDPSLLWLSAFGGVAVFIVTPYARVYDLALLIGLLIYLAFAQHLTWLKWARYGTTALVYACPIILIVMRADGAWNVLAVLGLAAALLATEPQTAQGWSAA